VPLIPDPSLVANATFFMNLSSATGAFVSDSQGIGTITPAPAPTSLQFTLQPTSAVAGNSIGTMVVEVFGPNGQLPNSTIPITLSITGGGTLVGSPTTIQATSGYAVFSGLSINQSGTYTLTATSGSLTGTSATFNITAAGATKLGFVHPLSN